MGNRQEKFQSQTYLREKQHLTFDKLRNGTLTFSEFKRDMLLYYVKIDPKRELPLGYRTFLTDHAKDKQDALSRKYEFDIESISINPCPSDILAKNDITDIIKLLLHKQCQNGT